MISERENAVDERGGIQLRDYTRGDGSHQNGRASFLKRVSFSKISRVLIWISLGLGLLEILIPGRLQKWLGVRGDYRNLIRFMGIREVAHAFLTFLQARPNKGIMTRVAGDALDLAALGTAFTQPHVKKNRVGIAAASVLGVTALDVITSRQLTQKQAEVKKISAVKREDLDNRTRDGAFRVTRSITINRSPEDVYQFWHNFENLPKFMHHLESVKTMDERHSHWTAKAPAKTEVSWDAEITEDRPNERIAWKSMPNADVTNSGVVHFVPGQAGRGTTVRVEIEYNPPGGAVGKAIATLFGEEPGQQVSDDLRRLKQVLETGEVVQSEGSPTGSGQKIPHPARPKAEEDRYHNMRLMPESERQRDQA